MGLSENGGIPIKWQFKRETDDELIHGFRGTLFSEQKHEKKQITLRAHFCASCVFMFSARKAAICSYHALSDNASTVHSSHLPVSYRLLLV